MSINGIAAPLYYVSPNQVNVLIPSLLTPLPGIAVLKDGGFLLIGKAVHVLLRSRAGSEEGQLFRAGQHLRLSI